MVGTDLLISTFPAHAPPWLPLPDGSHGLPRREGVSALAVEQLHPRYWLARAVWWAWQPPSAPWPTPQLAHGMALALDKGASSLTALRQAETAFLSVLADQAQANRDVAQADDVRAQHQKDLLTAQMSARPRFEATNPQALAWRKAADEVAKLEANESALIVRAETYDQEHSTPDREALLKRRYGQHDYQGNAVRKWLDDKLAASVKFEEYARRRNALFLQIDRLERQQEEAQKALKVAEEAMEAAWQAQGASFLDEEALEQAQALMVAAQEAMATAPQRKAAADRAAMVARRELTQALQAFHRQAGNAFWAAAQAAQAAAQRDEAALEALGDIDRHCFYQGQARGEQDNRRRDRIRQAGTWFLGQGPEPALEHGWPAWMALTYGNAEGLPGSLMAQAGMGLPPEPGAAAA